MISGDCPPRCRFLRGRGTSLPNTKGHFVNVALTASIEGAMNLDSLLVSRDAAFCSEVLRPALEKLSVDVQVCAEILPATDFADEA